MEIKTLFENPWVSIKQVGSWVYSHFTKSASETIGVLPYRLNGEAVEYGVIYEDIPCHTTSVFKQFYLITGAVEGNNIISTTVQELIEEAGIEVSYHTLEYRGVYLPLKHSDCEVHLFIVDVTGLEVKEAEGDGSEHEKRSEFRFISGEELIEATRDPNLVTAYVHILNKLKRRIK